MMNRSIMCVLGTLLLTSGCGDADDTGNANPGAANPAGFSLKNYEGKSPVLIVFGDDRADFMAQVEAQSEEIQAHNVVVVEVWDLSQNVKQGKVRGGPTLKELETMELADTFGPSPTGLTVVLVGMDGKVLAEQKSDHSAAALIDAMHH